MSRRATKPFVVEVRRSRSQKSASFFSSPRYTIDLPTAAEGNTTSVSEVANTLFEGAGPMSETGELSQRSSPRILPSLLQPEIDPVAERLAEAKRARAKRGRPARSPTPVTTDEALTHTESDPPSLPTVDATSPEQEPAQADRGTGTPADVGVPTSRLRGRIRSPKKFGPGERWKERRLKYLR